MPFCGSAKTAEHNQVMLEGVKSALLAAKGQRSLGSCKDAVGVRGKEEVRVWSKEERETGLKAFGRVYAGWGFSQVGCSILYERVRTNSGNAGVLSRTTIQNGTRLQRSRRLYEEFLGNLGTIKRSVPPTSASLLHQHFSPSSLPFPFLLFGLIK